MTERDFCYWLQGFVELTQGQTPCPAQWKSIKEHLDLVFKKVTPPVGETKTTVKVEIDAKDAEKTLDDLRKKIGEVWPIPKGPFAAHCFDATGQPAHIC